jgi:hypothetical protein
MGSVREECSSSSGGGMTECPTKNKGATEILHTVFLFVEVLWCRGVVLMVLTSLRSE